MSELTPEEKKRIYEEEKARLAAQKKIKAEQTLKGCGVLIAILVVLGVLGAIFPAPTTKKNEPEIQRGSATTGDSDEAIHRSAPSSSSLLAQTKSPIEFGRLGAPITFERVSYLAKTLAYTDKIGSGYHQEVSPKGSLYAIVGLEMENVGSSPITLIASNFKLVDSKNRLFEPDVGAHFKAQLSGVRVTEVIEKLQPGIRFDGYIIFLVPMNLKNDGEGVSFAVHNVVGNEGIVISLK